MSDEPIRLNPHAGAPRRTLGLGRGLDALLGEVRGRSSDNASATPGLGATSLPIGSIQPHDAQPRRRFDEDALDELAASIAQHGVIQPIVVRPLSPGTYQLVAGERRWRAAQRAQLQEIPALIRDLDDRQVMTLALVENLQRADLNPIEEARAYARLATDEGLSQAEIARLVGKSRSHVANLQRLLTLPDQVIALVEGGDLSMGHARALIGADEAIAIAGAAIDGQLSVRNVEERVRRSVAGGNGARNRTPRTTRASPDDEDLAAVQQNLETLLGLPVRISAGQRAGSGAVTVSYDSLDQLDLICQRLTGRAI